MRDISQMLKNYHCIQEENHKTQALPNNIKDMGKKKKKQRKKRKKYAVTQL